MKRSRVFEIVLTVALAGVVYLMAHDAATADRHYEAIGGEIFLPFLILFARPIWAAIKEPLQLLKERK